jgi:predicted acyltransferase
MTRAYIILASLGAIVLGSMCLVLVFCAALSFTINSILYTCGFVMVTGGLAAISVVCILTLVQKIFRRGE